MNRPDRTGEGGGATSGSGVLERVAFAGAFLVAAMVGMPAAVFGAPGSVSNRASGTTGHDRRPAVFDPNEPPGSAGRKVSVEEP